MRALAYLAGALVRSAHSVLSSSSCFYPYAGLCAALWGFRGCVGVVLRSLWVWGLVGWLQGVLALLFARRGGIIVVGGSP